jgi:hypothetical protein
MNDAKQATPQKTKKQITIGKTTDSQIPLHCIDDRESNAKKTGKKAPPPRSNSQLGAKTKAATNALGSCLSQQARMRCVSQYVKVRKPVPISHTIMNRSKVINANAA